MHTCMHADEVGASVMSVSLCMQGLFCHTFLNTDHVSFVMGFDGGIIEQRDMRMQMQPYVQASLPMHGQVISSNTDSVCESLPTTVCTGVKMQVCLPSQTSIFQLMTVTCWW